MTVRTFLVGSFFALVIFWGIWFLIINWVRPSDAQEVGLILFFSSFFLGVASAAALIGYVVRRLVTPSQLPAYRVRTSLRQAVWLGIFLDLLLFLQLQRLLRWWVTVIIIVLFLSLEFLFLTYDRSIGRHQGSSGTGN